jgi:hypothetical protein
MVTVLSSVLEAELARRARHDLAVTVTSSVLKAEVANRIIYDLAFPVWWGAPEAEATSRIRHDLAVAVAVRIVAVSIASTGTGAAVATMTMSVTLKSTKRKDPTNAAGQRQNVIPQANKTPLLRISRRDLQLAFHRPKTFSTSTSPKKMIMIVNHSDNEKTSMRVPVSMTASQYGEKQAGQTTSPHQPASSTRNQTSTINVPYPATPPSVAAAQTLPLLRTTHPHTLLPPTAYSTSPYAPALTRVTTVRHARTVSNHCHTQRMSSQYHIPTWMNPKAQGRATQ